MNFEFLRKFEHLYRVIEMLDYGLSIFGSLFIAYALFVFSVITMSLVRTKNLDSMRAIHIFAAVEVYAFVCGIIGVILISNIYNLTLFKVVIFLVIVIFSAVTTTRLIAKTAYFKMLKNAKKG